MKASDPLRMAHRHRGNEKGDNRLASLPRRALMTLSLIAATAVVYWPSSAGLWSYWLDEGNSATHGPLVALISLWLLLRSREALASAPVQPVRWAYPGLLLCSAASLLFWRSGIETLQLLLLPPLMLLAVLGAMGAPAARIAAFPLGYLYFAMPGWGYLWPTLQRLTIAAVTVIAPLIGLPARVAGDVVTLPAGGVFEIGSACSGVNFLVVGLAVAALMGELERGSPKRRITLLALMGAVALVSNWIRVLLIIGIGYATDMRNRLATDDHLLLGWVVFAIVLLLFVWLASRAAVAPAGRGERSSSDRTPKQSPGALANGPLADRPAADRSPVGRPVAAHPLAGYLAVLAALLVFPAWVYGRDAAQGAGGPQAIRDPLPQGEAPWHGPLASTDGVWQPVFVGPHSQWHAVYDGPRTQSVEVVAIGYARQAHGRKLVSEENSLLGSRGLTAVASGTAVADGALYRRLTVVDGSGHRSLIWSVYDIGGRRFATPLYSQLWYGIRSFVQPTYSVLFALKAPCEPSCAAAHTTLESFVRSVGGRLFTLTKSSQADRRGDSA